MSDAITGALRLAGVAVLLTGCSLRATERSTAQSSPTVPTTARAADETPTSNRNPPNTREAQQAVVTKVIDGDTFDVSIGGTQERVRLIGIDTPEAGDCLYDEATQSLADLLASGEVDLTVDTTDRDRFGRLLRYVWVDDSFVNEAQVSTGLAVARRYEPDTAEAERLEMAEAAATAAQRGRWAPAACGALATNVDGSISELRIDYLEFDAPGDDSIELNGEWIRIINDGAASVQMEGWQVRDESVSHRYEFPVMELAPGAAITIYSGCGVDSPTELFWCSTSSAVWNNGGDTAYLIDPSGNVITSFTY